HRRSANRGSRPPTSRYPASGSLQKPKSARSSPSSNHLKLRPPCILMPMSDPMQQAIALHQAGKLREAETLYRHVLAQQPNHPAALNMLGVLAAQVGQLLPAEQWIRQSIAI